MTIIPEDLALCEPKKSLIEKMTKNDPKERVLFKVESDFHNIFIVENKIGRFLKYGDTYQAGVIDSLYYKGNLPYINYFLIPYLMNKNIKNILLIGFGSGVLVGQFEKIFSNLQGIDIVDIEEYVFPLAEKYFDFNRSDKMNFYLQDALVYLKTEKKKYDLIIADVAGNDGIDERFCNSGYLKLIKEHLKKAGIFVSNMPSSRDVFNKKNKFVLNLLNDYKKVLQNIAIYNGETSNKVFYKTFFDMDEIVMDVTNLILISSDKKYNLSKDYSVLNNIGVDIAPYVSDCLKK